MEARTMPQVVQDARNKLIRWRAGERAGVVPLCPVVSELGRYWDGHAPNLIAWPRQNGIVMRRDRRCDGVLHV